MSKLKIMSKYTSLKLVNNLKEDKSTWNICFVNATIQTINGIPEFRNYFKSIEYGDSNPKYLPICKEITRLLKSEGKSLENAGELRKLIGESFQREDMFDGSQQDVLDFHDLLLRIMHSELSLINDQDGLRIINNFYGSEKNEKRFLYTVDGKCSQGHSVRTAEENFLVLELVVPDSNQELSLNIVVANHYAENSSTVFMKCSDCCPHKGICPQSGKCKLMEAISQKSLISTPKYLFIQLMRFPSHLSKKINTKVRPDNLLVLPNDEKFNLISIVNHLGSRARSGHYQAVIKSGSRWIKCDDAVFFKTDLKNELSGSNYVFVYEKNESKSFPVPLSAVNDDLIVGQSELSKDTEEIQDKTLNDDEPIQFVFIDGETKIEEIECGKLQCACKEVLSFSSTVHHLLNSKCKNKSVVKDFIASWTKYRKRKVDGKKNNVTPASPTEQAGKRKAEDEAKLNNVENRCEPEEKISKGKSFCQRVLIEKSMSFEMEESIPNSLTDSTVSRSRKDSTIISKSEQDKRNRSILNNKPPADDQTFIYVKGAKTFAELDDGKVECGGCMKKFLRIVSHLKNNVDCRASVDMEEFNLAWTRHIKRRKNARFEQKQRAENEEKFLREKAKRQKKSDQKKRAENEEKYLREKAQVKRRCDQQRRIENEEKFLKEKAEGRRRSDEKKKVENKGKFLRDQAKRWRKCNYKQNQNIEATERLRRFKKAIRFGPIFLCRCCERKLFENQIVEVEIDTFKENVDKIEPGLFEECISTYSRKKFPNMFLESTEYVFSSDIDNRNFLCKGCKLSMERGKMPKMCSNNGLKVDILPKPEMRLSELENNLIARNIVFQKIHLLPKSRWSGTHDRLVNIPIGEQDIVNTLTSLPRTPTEAGILTVGLKRKLEYKTTHLQQLINVKKIYDYLHFLKYEAKNKYYKFYDDYNVFIERCNEEAVDFSGDVNEDVDDLIGEVDVCQDKQIPEDNIEKNTTCDLDPDDEKEDEEYRTKDVVRKFQFDYDMTTVMVPRYPEALPDQEINVAPGEGKIPSNILKEEDWDVKSFPNLFPSGTNGIKQNREVGGLTDQQFIEQRLKNKDTRFEQCTPYVFALTAYIEEKQLERNIGISYLKGKKTVGKEGGRRYALEDSFAVLDNVKGTPRYWSKAKKEMLAKLDNFGPFHFFYTLSCADMRWDENFTSILKEKEYKIIWISNNNCNDDSLEVKVEFGSGVEKQEKSLRNFLEENVDDSLHEFIRTNVFIATRNFIHRVKAFRKEIMLGHNSPMAIENWSDKMEFQG